MGGVRVVHMCMHASVCNAQVEHYVSACRDTHTLFLDAYI